MKKVLVIAMVLAVSVIGVSIGSTTADSRVSEQVGGIACTTAYRSGSRVTEGSKRMTHLISTLRKNKAERSKAVESQGNTGQVVPTVQEQLLTQEEVPVVNSTEEEPIETQEATPSADVCDGRFHNNGICDGSCVGNAEVTNYGHHMGNGTGICDGTGHGNGICDGSCINSGNDGATQAGGNGNSQGVGSYGHSSSHGNGHGNGHRR
ncbi:hypothetical protein [Candidatus Enterococcus clewellii]|uniref:Uncharacterized protein n=1 Tax=Candidatus Enterococcus clewellii TaxID=1834193 RepID=A0A242JY14_9ENTE|nr:hypothetical protein [Enterococcus sp. 9E7_DIV0242]OTP09821.1 hypothetical protein A5888_004017 [Enterococcus sp. 9E7_DIV0242]